MAFLTRVSIEGYRSIKSVDLELSRLNVLIGANGTGKSNFISFFKMLNEMIAGRLQSYIGTTGRAHSLLHFGPKMTPYLKAVLEFESENRTDTYDMTLSYAANDSITFVEERFRDGLTQSTSPGSGHQETWLASWSLQDDKTAKTFEEILSHCRVYHFHDTSPSSRMRQFGYVGDNRWLQSDAGNLAAMLYAYRQKAESVYRRIVSTIQKIMPGFSDFDLQPDRLNPQEISLNWRREGADYLFGPHQISDGTLRAIAIVTLFLQPDDDLPDVIVLDEPELGLHPQAIEIVAGLMRAASLKSQIIVATQSQAFLEHFEPSEIVVVDSWKNSSRFQRLNAQELSDWLADYSIGELWEKNVLGGGPIP